MYNVGPCYLYVKYIYVALQTGQVVPCSTRRTYTYDHGIVGVVSVTWDMYVCMF